MRDYLLDALESHAMASEYTPQTIDLADFGKQAENLVQLSRSSDGRFEYASVAYADNKRRIRLSRPVRGDGETVYLPPLPKGRRRVLIIHTHGDVDTPFSPADLEALFIRPPDERAVPAVLLATPTLKMLILRGKYTPFLSIAGIEEVVERMHLHDAMSEEAQLFKSRYEAAGGKEPLLTADYKQALAQISNRRMFVLTRFAHEYDLRIYSCALERNFAYGVS